MSRKAKAKAAAKFVYEDDMQMDGHGPLRAYFKQEEGASEWMHEKLDKAIPGFMDEIDERNDHIDRLCLQLFSEFSGISPDAEVTVRWPEMNYQGADHRILPELINENRTKGGLLLIGWQPDDPIIALYRDGQPVSAFYASYRGVYQAGGYVMATNKHYFAHDFAPEAEAGPMNTWVDDGESSRGCSSIAEDFLKSQGMFDWAELEAGARASKMAQPYSEVLKSRRWLVYDRENEEAYGPFDTTDEAQAYIKKRDDEYWESDYKDSGTPDNPVHREDLDNGFWQVISLFTP